MAQQLELALPIFEGTPETEPREPAARFALARARVESDGDAAQAIALAQQAAVQYRQKDGQRSEHATEIDAWLAARSR